jgi:two-component system, OmpR family, alkaline phosphatase synthesis response regulator PhoP
MALKNKILIVDDNDALRKVIRRYLENHEFSVVDTDNGSQALILAKEARPDIVLSDAQMPGLDGLTLCRVLRQESTTEAIPLIIMTGACVDEKSMLTGYENGADDYILKPFSFPVLAARIRAVLRRYENVFKNGVKLKKTGLEIDPTGRSLKVNGKPVSLTRKEFDLLTLLVSRPGRVLGVPFLLENVWGYDLTDYNDPATVEVHISRLRKKLGPKMAKHIVNMTGNGYKFEE